MATLKEAVRYCIEKGILVEFLSLHGSEVENMLFTEFNLDDAKRVWHEEAEQNKALKIARKMLERGKSIEEIVEFTELTEEQIKDLHLDY